MDDVICPRCGGTTEAVIMPPESIHHSKLRCTAHGCYWFKWLPKPDATKAKRPASHRDLVARFSRGFCEFCLRRPEDMPPKCVLEGHHVQEFQDGGEPTRENVQIICSACHTMVAWMRKNLGRNNVN